jgi:hypothetical protein
MKTGKKITLMILKLHSQEVQTPKTNLLGFNKGNLVPSNLPQLQCPNFLVINPSPSKGK